VDIGVDRPAWLLLRQWVYLVYLSQGEDNSVGALAGRGRDEQLAPQRFIRANAKI
jgi:hypothetical protein